MLTNALEYTKTKPFCLCSSAPYSRLPIGNGRKVLPLPEDAIPIPNEQVHQILLISCPARREILAGTNTIHKIRKNIGKRNFPQGTPPKHTPYTREYRPWCEPVLPRRENIRQERTRIIRQSLQTKYHSNPCKAKSQELFLKTITIPLCCNEHRHATSSRANKISSLWRPEPRAW